MPVTSVSFHNDRGDRLSGLLEEPDAGAPAAFALFAHCFTCSKDFKAPVWISQALAERGLATLRFDFPGLGASAGAFEDTTLSGNVADVVSAARFLRERYAAPEVLIGHSMGGAAVLRAAGQLPEIRWVATLAAPVEPGSVGPALQAARLRIEQQGVAELVVAGRRLMLRKSFFDDLDASPLSDVVAQLPAALAVFHAPADTIVPIGQGERLFALAPHPKSFVSLDGGGHLFDRRQDCQLVAEVLVALFRRELPAPPVNGASHSG